MKFEPFQYVITDHAAFELKRRGISPDIIRGVMEQPEQQLAVREGREVFQSRIQMGGRRYLVRVFVDIDRQPAEVVTAYRTGKIVKYWRGTP